jgi:Phage integrase, N-terminal SAM-like domain
MSDSELAVVSVDSFAAPTIIERAGPTTRKKFFEFFTVPIRNANTRATYYRAIQQFLAWCERAGYQDIEDIEPITVAAYIETLQRQAAPPTVKQHMADPHAVFLADRKRDPGYESGAGSQDREVFTDGRQNAGIC